MKQIWDFSKKNYLKVGLLIVLALVGFCGTGDRITISEDELARRRAAKKNPRLKKSMSVKPCDKRDEDGATQYIRAARFGKRGEMLSWLARGCDVNAVDNYGWTALTWSASKGFKEASKDILNAGGKVDPIDRNGATPLMYAAWGGHKDIVKLLLDKGAKNTVKSKAGYKAEDYAKTDEIQDMLK